VDTALCQLDMWVMIGPEYALIPGHGNRATFCNPMQTRVLLINTPFPLGEYPVPPLGLAYIAGALEKEGVDVQVLDLLVAQYSPQTLQKRLREYQPHFVAATCSTLNYHIASRILRVCKNSDTNLTTLIGGPHVSFAATEVMEEAPWIDVVVRGEGERTLVDLLDALATGKDLARVPGIAYRNNGDAVLTSPRPLIKELDGLPLPARHLLPLSKYRALKAPCTVITSRGCPFGCIFCSAPKMFGRGVRFRDPKAVVDEIEMINRELGFRQINVVDDTFTVKEQHVQSICEGVMDRGLNIQWSVYSRVDTVTPRLLRLMKVAGCSCVCFGLESGSQKILDNIKKGITVAQSKQAVRMAKEAGMEVMVSFLLGLPGENGRTAQQSVRLAEELRKEYGVYYGFHILAPMPGTEVREKADEYGIRILSHDWAKYDANRPVSEPIGFSRDRMKRILADYEQSISTAWEEIQSEAERGDPLCRERVAATVTQDFVWRLLKRNAIERLGGSNHCPSGMAERLSRMIDVPLDVTEREMAKLFADGTITPTEAEPGACSAWQWA
jgi:anaerobic magnesium-protoporphyrin IX monomethyl ester cyclase